MNYLGVKYKNITGRFFKYMGGNYVNIIFSYTPDNRPPPVYICYSFSD